jgi:hypothetical protein
MLTNIGVDQFGSLLAAHCPGYPLRQPLSGLGTSIEVA